MRVPHGPESCGPSEKQSRAANQKLKVTPHPSHILSLKDLGHRNRCRALP